MTYATLRRAQREPSAFSAAPSGFFGEARAERTGAQLAWTLQRSVGNRAVGQLLSARAPQPALRIGEPGDAYEREADGVADRVMRMANGGGARAPVSESSPAVSALQRCACGCGGSCGSTEEDKIHRSAEGPAPTNVAPSVVHDVIRSPGAPLDSGTRAYMEPRFGHDFSHVRIHTDERAADSARAVNATAYAVGSHMVFDRGRYAPGSTEGRRLIAHELTHVVQQQSAGEPVIQRELVYASGYANRFRSDRAEVGCYQSRPRCQWFPSTVDFRQTAINSGGGIGRATFTDLLDHIAAAAPGSITELGLIGHADRTWFGLGGTITANDVVFTEEGVIGAGSIEPQMTRIAGLRNRFAKGATITLYGCHAGAGQGLLDAISNAFQVCARGFTNEIITCLRWNTPSLDIFSRGRTWVETGILERRPEEIGCANFHLDVREMIPDRESCVGVPVAPAPPPAKTAEPAPRRFGLTGMAGAAVSDQTWRGALDLGLRYSLRSDRFLVIDPTIGAHILYLPAGGGAGHVAAAIAEVGVRIRQPRQGFFVDAHAGGYGGFEIAGDKPGQTTGAVGGFTAALGAGYRWERVELGAQGRALVGGASSQVVIIGAGVAW